MILPARGLFVPSKLMEFDDIVDASSRTRVGVASRAEYNLSRVQINILFKPLGLPSTNPLAPRASAER